MILKLQRHLRKIGEGVHRSGWPYALKSLEPLDDRDGILFDDFVERSFCYDPLQQPYAEPWVGVFHHPPHLPPFAPEGQRFEAFTRTALWRASRPHLRLAIALSRHTGEFLETELKVPTAVIAHPTETPTLKFTTSSFEQNKDRKIIQLGWKLRNTQAIYQLAAPAGFRKARTKAYASWAEEFENKVAEYWSRTNSRPLQGGVEVLPWADDHQFDTLLAKNAVFMELFASSANNAVVECIVRDTPLIVNRLPSLEEYLGKDYPLFYDDFDKAGELFAFDRLIAGHQYLRAMDKTRFDGNYFRNQVAAAVLALSQSRGDPSAPIAAGSATTPLPR